MANQTAVKPIQNESKDTDMATTNELMQQLAKLTAELAAQTARADKAEVQAKQAQANKGKPYLKVSEKGAVSLYRINTRFPITLYGNQWEKVLDMAAEIKAFLAENQDKLSVLPADAGKGSQGNVVVLDPAKPGDVPQHQH